MKLIKKFLIEISGFRDDIVMQISFIWCTFNFILWVRYGLILNHYDVISYSGFDSLLVYLISVFPAVYVTHWVCLYKKSWSKALTILMLPPCIVVNYILTDIILNDFKWPVGY